MASTIATVRITLRNPRAIKALQFAARIMNELHDDIPWRPELTKAVKALTYAAKHLTAETE